MEHAEKSAQNPPSELPWLPVLPLVTGRGLILESRILKPLPPTPTSPYPYIGASTRRYCRLRMAGLFNGHRLQRCRPAWPQYALCSTKQASLAPLPRAAGSRRLFRLFFAGRLASNPAETQFQVSDSAPRIIRAFTFSITSSRLSTPRLKPNVPW